MYEVFEHTADLGLRIIAATRDELFAEAGRGLLHVIVANPEAVRSTQSVEFHIPGEQLEYLLLDWLVELLFVFETQHLLLADFVVRVGPEGLTATARGEPIDPARHQLDHEVKAVTYHGLKCEQALAGWQAEVILDI